jgi:chaperonin cofactor prefoldin
MARQNLARKLQVGVSTVEHLVRGRAKIIDANIRDRLQALLVRELEQEIGRLTHDLEIARQTGAHLASDEISEVESHLAAARSLLKGNAQ